MIGEDNFTSLRLNNIALLGENLQDAKWAAKSKGMTVKYNLALSKLLHF